jgi:hypothetical protein
MNSDHPWQEIKDTPKASVGQRTKTLRIVAFAIMSKYDTKMTHTANLMGLGRDRDVGASVIPIVDVECLETLIFGASPP